MELEPQVGVAATPLNVTVLLPWVAPKFDPLTVTIVPTGPAVVDRLLISGAFTVIVACVLWTRLPLVPVMVSVELPSGVEAEVATVSVELPAPLIDVGLNVAVAFAGNPVKLKATLPVKPLMAAVETV